jgi:hypothetical protein
MGIERTSYSCFSIGLLAINKFVTIFFIVNVFSFVSEYYIIGSCEIADNVAMARSNYHKVP